MTRKSLASPKAPEIESTVPGVKPPTPELKTTPEPPDAPPAVIARLPPITFIPVRLIVPPAARPRFVSVMIPEPVMLPPVRRAKFVVPDGAMSAETVMAPVLVPPSSPTRIVPAVIRFSSAEVSESLPAVSVPRSICIVVVAGARVTTPEVEVIVLAVLITMVSALIKAVELVPVVKFELIVAVLA